MSGMYSSTLVSSVTSCPWWVHAEMEEIIWAPTDSPYALWPIGFGNPESPTPYNAQSQKQILPFRNPYSYPQITGYRLQPTSLNILLELGMASVPSLLEHLDDPRLTGVILRDRYFYPAPVGRACFEVLCQIAGFSFLDIDPDIQSELTSDGLRISSIDRTHPQMIVLTPRIHAYIQEWWRDCSGATAAESILWHVNRSPTNDPKAPNYLVTAAEKGAKQEALSRLKTLHAPDNPRQEQAIAAALIKLGDTSRIDSIFEKFMKGTGNARFYGVNLISRYGTALQKRQVIKKLLERCDRDDPLLTYQTFQSLLLMGDISLLPDLTLHLENGAFSSLEYEEGQIITHICTYGSSEQQRAVLNRLQTMIESVLLQEPFSKPLGTGRRRFCPPLLTRACEMAVLFSNKCEPFLAAEALAMFLQFYCRCNQTLGEVDKNDSGDFIVRRISDIAAMTIADKKLVDIDFQYTMPLTERNKRIEEMLPLLLEKYPLIEKNPLINSTK